MRRRAKQDNGDLLAGTLDMLILRILQAGPAHGLEIAQRIERQSDDVLLIEQGSLYPALHRLEQRGLLAPAWRPSETGREAKYYRLTRAGRAQLDAERASWRRLTRAIGVVLRSAEGETS